MQNRVKFAFKRGNNLNGSEITRNFCENQQMIAILVFPGLIRRLKTYSLRSACKMEWKERLNVEISQTGKK